MNLKEIFETSAVAKPAIETQPSSISIRIGGSATFTVMASGQELTYQWFGPNGMALSDIPGEIVGATTATLRIFNIQSNDTGSYLVQVFNPGGSVNSTSFSLTIGIQIFVFCLMLLLVYFLLQFHRL